MSEIIIDNIGGFCPVQAEGTIDGWPFYFRARGSAWSLDVAEPGFDGCGESVWEHEQGYGDGPYDAGCMEEDEARQFINQAAVLFTTWRLENPQVDGSGRRTAEILREKLKELQDWYGKEIRYLRGQIKEVEAERNALRIQIGDPVGYPEGAKQ